MFLKHYGTPRHSGRYPWGTGQDPNQGSDSIISRVDNLRRKGLSEKEAAKSVGMSIADVRSQRSLEKAEKRAADVSMAQKLKAKGMSDTAIGERMGKNESSVRSLLNHEISERSQITKNTTDMLRTSVGKDKYVDIGSGIEAHLGVSSTRLKVAVKALENEGYKVHNIQTDQLGTDKKTTVKVITPPGTTYKDVVTNKNRIILPGEYSEDGGRTYLGIKPPVSVSSSRIKIIHGEDGGADRDGLIELRRGVADISLPPGKKYAQVRIAVDDTHYLKGMAVYSDKLPKGSDVQFYTSKLKGGSKLDAMKSIKDDPENPFGSSIKQYEYHDAAGRKRQSKINIVGSDKAANEEGRWGEWSKTLSSQVLSKQPNALAEQQLGLARKSMKLDYDEISALTNPAVKRRLLNSLADDADASAGHLKAAALPRQMNHVILPVVSMPDHQVYAPNYRTGEKVVLIRHPHGGKFEIPELTVNNNHPEAKRVMGRATDAVGISPKVAKRLSGADFDGDTVLVIPNRRGNNQIHTSAPLERLKDFDPISSYPHVPGMKVMSSGGKQRAMGDVSNLITDMTIKGASPSEIARAVRHSMVVIDSEKHSLNYKLSETDNGIRQLKEKYQGKTTAGAATLISRAGSELHIPTRKEGSPTGPPNKTTGKPTRQYIDPKTGKKLYENTGETYINKKGIEVQRKSTVVTRMQIEDDAHKLSSGTTMEAIYANHANALKTLANTARKDSINVKNIPYSPLAKKQHAKEVDSLNTKLKAAVANRPLERRAQLIANDIVSTKRKNNPHLTQEELKKLKGQALTEARNRVGAKKPAIIITPKEWMAIQKGAISNHKLEEIINNADLDVVRSLATPRPKTKVSATVISRAKRMSNSGQYTQAQIADQLGISTSTLRTLL
jgi:hypothetical protein